jgi:hypothetical protein
MKITYNACKKYLDFAYSLEENGTICYGIGDWSWPIENRLDMMTNRFLDTVSYYQMANILSKTAKILNNEEDYKTYLNKAQEIKKADKSVSKKLKLISIVSCVSMTFLGYFALGAVGAIIFLIISYTASFALTLSMKKKTLIAYLKHYRETLIPSIMASDKIDKPSSPAYLNLLYPDTLHHWTVCYKSNNTAFGFARLYKGASEIANGMAVCSDENRYNGRIFKGFFPTLSDDYVEERVLTGALPENIELFADVLEKHFNSYAMVFSSDGALLFLPDASDFASGRVEDKNDVSEKALARQYAYARLAEAFSSLDTNKLNNVCPLFNYDKYNENNE